MLAERLADHIAIERLNADFSHELDRGTPDGFAALFSGDAIYANGARIANGQAAIRAFAQNRVAAGPRTSRHVVTGLRIDFEGLDRARGISVCVTYSASGTAPIHSTLPSIIADFQDVYVRSDDGWRFAERHIHPVFLPAATGSN